MSEEPKKKEKYKPKIPRLYNRKWGQSSDRRIKKEDWNKPLPPDSRILEPQAFLETLPMFYQRVLSQTLQSAVMEQLDAPVSDQLNLLEELAIVRNICSGAIAGYSCATQQLENAIASGDAAKIAKEHETKEAFGQLALQALKNVAAFCKKAAEIDNMSRDKYSIHTINSVVAQITRLMFDVCEKTGHPELAVMFEERVKTDLRVPKAIGNTNEGTTITPSDDVLEMDATIPKEPE